MPLARFGSKPAAGHTAGTGFQIPVVSRLHPVWDTSVKDSLPCQGGTHRPWVQHLPFLLLTVRIASANSCPSTAGAPALLLSWGFSKELQGWFEGWKSCFGETTEKLNPIAERIKR